MEMIHLNKYFGYEGGSEVRCTVASNSPFDMPKKIKGFSHASAIQTTTTIYGMNGTPSENVTLVDQLPIVAAIIMSVILKEQELLHNTHQMQITSP